MKKSGRKLFVKIIGILIGLAAVYVALTGVSGKDMSSALKGMQAVWLIPIFFCNVCVIMLKTLRWQILLKPLKEVGFFIMFQVVLIGFMMNNVLPVRFGEAVRVHMMGKEMTLSRVTTAASLVADKILEGISFLALAAILFCFEGVPSWMNYGFFVTFVITFAACVLIIIYSRKEIKNPFLQKIQDGFQPLMSSKVFFSGFTASIFSWFLQVAMIYMTQLAFNVSLPVWGTVLVLIAVNLVVVIPSAPANLGTFELACILSYSFLGIDKELGLLIGVTYHLIQFIPVTFAGGILLISKQFFKKNVLAQDTSC